MKEKKVLVIDDDDQIREVIEECLEDEGYTVITAENGRTGLELALSNQPDLVLLDVELPDYNGYDICKKMRENTVLMHTPIIMLTARNMESDEVTGFNAGADDYVAKPFKPGRLLARIQSAISRTSRELDANALTHLPGNVAITEEIQNRIKQEKPFSVIYMDLNNFKSFNDRYGFLRGDEAIKLTSELLSEVFSEKAGENAFLGHVGGDDFVGVVANHDVGSLCEQIVEKFDNTIAQLYDEEDRQKGKIQSKNRKGEKVEIPIMGLAIAVVTNRRKKFKHPGEIAFIAGDLKKWVKSENKSAYLVDRRT